MPDPIYIVDPATRRPIRVDPVQFSDIGIRERDDLEQWVINYPDLLGEPLLVLTSEYARFDRSSRRLDILALDKDGVLVVIELKLDVASSLADQQAIRYAAFCSTMTMADAVESYARHNGCTKAEGEKAVLGFLEQDELPQLNDRPRIILAAGSIEDQELTACVLWLRRFGLDISCVELTPYRLRDSGQVILVPRTIIPLPESRDYIIQVEKKEAAKASDDREKSGNEVLWTAVSEAFNKPALPLKANAKARGSYLQVPIGDGAMHYEWMMRKRDKCIHVAIHFEDSDTEKNFRWLKQFEAEKAKIERELAEPLFIGDFGRKWKQVRIAVPYDGTQPTNEVAASAAATMKRLYDATWPLLSKIKASNS